MSSLRDFGDAARGLAKNPLGIIALFIVLIYGFASLVVGFSSRLEASERKPIIWFLVVFPVIVIGVFGWLVSRHHQKLYAPKDFSSDESFVNMYDRSRPREGLQDLEQQIGTRIREALTSEELVRSMGGNRETIKARLNEAAIQVTAGIKASSFIAIDARQFTDDDTMIFELPVSAFASVEDLANEIYFMLVRFVDPYTYGYSWILQNESSGRLLEYAGMITRELPGIPCSDPRSLKEVGIEPGDVLVVKHPKKSLHRWSEQVE